MKLNDFSLELLTYDSNRLEGIILTNSNSTVSQTLLQNFRTDLLNSVPSYVVTHFFVSDHKYGYNSDSLIIDEKYEIFLKNISNFSFDYHTYLTKEYLHINNVPVKKQEKFLAIGEFCAPYEMIVRCGDLKIYSFCDETLSNYSQSIRYHLTECWNPEQVLFKYKGNNEKLMLILVLQEGHLNKMCNLSIKEASIIQNLFLNHDYHQFSDKLDMLSTQHNNLPTKCIFRELPYYWAYFTPFETISLFEMHDYKIEPCTQISYSLKNLTQIIYIYLSITCKHPTNILSAIEHCFIEYPTRYLSQDQLELP